VHKVHYVFEATKGLQFFTLPFTGLWRLYARGGYGGNFAMQEGGHPAQVPLRFSLLLLLLFLLLLLLFLLLLLLLLLLLRKLHELCTRVRSTTCSMLNGALVLQNTI